MHETYIERRRFQVDVPDGKLQTAMFGQPGRQATRHQPRHRPETRGGVKGDPETVIGGQVSFALSRPHNRTRMSDRLGSTGPPAWLLAN